MVKILIYTFFRTSPARAINNISATNLKKLYIVGKRGTSKLLAHLNNQTYDYILGVGSFTKAAKKIRIDQKYGYLYGKSQIFPVGEEFYAPTWHLPVTDNSYVSDKTSNGPCNYSAYSVSRHIADNQLPTKFAFAHVPRNMPLEQVEWTINYWLQALDEQK